MIQALESLWLDYINGVFETGTPLKANLKHNHTLTMNRQSTSGLMFDTYVN